MKCQFPIRIAANLFYNCSAYNLLRRHSVCPNIILGYSKVLSCQGVYAIVAIEYRTDLCKLFCLGVSGYLSQRKLLIAYFSHLFMTT